MVLIIDNLHMAAKGIRHVIDVPAVAGEHPMWKRLRETDQMIATLLYTLTHTGDPHRVFWRQSLWAVQGEIWACSNRAGGSPEMVLRLIREAKNAAREGLAAGRTID